MTRRPRVRTLCLVVGFLMRSVLCTAEDHAGEHGAHERPTPGPGWVWHGEAHVVFGFNAQQRRFRDFHVWESQNWFMADGQRPLGKGAFRLSSMFSLEPWTLKAIG